MTLQKRLIKQLENEDGNSWLIMLDAGRPDYFQELYEDYIDGDYETVYNGGIMSTNHWFKTMFGGDVSGHLFHAGTPIVGLNNPHHYNEREHFRHVPSANLYGVYGVGLPFKTTPPSSVNEVVKIHLPTNSIVSDRLRDLGYVPSGEDAPAFDMNVVRYLQPHMPYRSLEDIRNQRESITRMIENGEMTFEELEDAYVDNYKWGLSGVKQLLDIINEHAENIVVTADHGECLGDCGEWFHGSGGHDHLVNVPWLRVR